MTGGLAKTKQAQELKPIQVPFGMDTYAIQVEGIILHIPHNKRIGQIEQGIICTRQGWIQADSAEYYVSDRPYKQMFLNELSAQNYTLVTQGKSFFEDGSATEPDFIIGGYIIDMEANLCFPGFFGSTTHKSKGSAYLKIEWQVYGTHENKVVYTAWTHGSAIIKERVVGASGVALDKAFSMAARNLMADENFYNLLVVKEAAQ